MSVIAVDKEFYIVITSFYMQLKPTGLQHKRKLKQTAVINIRKYQRISKKTGSAIAMHALENNSKVKAGVPVPFPFCLPLFGEGSALQP